MSKKENSVIIMTKFLKEISKYSREDFEQLLQKNSKKKMFRIFWRTDDVTKIDTIKK